MYNENSKENKKMGKTSEEKITTPQSKKKEIPHLSFKDDTVIIDDQNSIRLSGLKSTRNK